MIYMICWQLANFDQKGRVAGNGNGKAGGVWVLGVDGSGRWKVTWDDLKGLG